RLDDGPPEKRREAMLSWFAQAEGVLGGLGRLLEQVSQHHIELGGVDCNSLVEYDRQHTIQETLLERIITAQVEVAEASYFVLAAASATHARIGDDLDWPVALSDDWRLAASLMAALLRRDPREAQARCAEFVEALEDVPLLYVPLSRGGKPREIVAARLRQRMLQNLLIMLPRLGLLDSARDLIETARRLEREHPVGAGAVTEFDDLFEVGYEAMAEAVIAAVESWQVPDANLRETTIVALLNRLTQPVSRIWIDHSRTLRLSVLEKVADDKAWSQLVKFIRRYGGDLFTQQFLNLGNVRAIQHQGVERWIERATLDPDYAGRLKLLDDLEQGLSPRRVVKLLSLILEAISENYAEYRDYNATTTQSDRGELLYMLLDFL
ncbi:MAG: hypothetical protein KDA41_04875, partial [Planctomycetales bacterium]|nr:hypothetical protein [Planctomycetales bacterium]